MHPLGGSCTVRVNSFMGNEREDDSMAARAKAGEGAPQKVPAPPKKTKKAEAVEATEAIPVEKPTSALVVRIEGMDIVANFDALAARVAEIAKEFEGMEVTAGSVAEAKRYRAYLNGVAKSIDEERKRVKREFTAPVTAFELKVKELLAPVQTVSADLDRQVKAFEEEAKRKKVADLRTYWADYAGILADVVHFETIFDPKWENLSVTFGDACHEIENIVARIANEEAMLTDMKLPHLDGAKARYFETLSLGEAITRSKELEAQEAATKKFEAEKAELLAAQEESLAAPVEAPEPAPEPEPVAAPAPVAPSVPAYPATAGDIAQREPAEPRSDWTFTFAATRSEAQAIADYAKSIGVKGSAHREKG